MRKIAYLLSCFFMVANISACSSGSDDLASINPVENEQITQTLSAKADADVLVKKMVDKRFTFADKNKDKKLVFNEFKGLESENADIMKKRFDKVDTDKNATVTYEEFVKSDTVVIKDTLKQIFSMMDQNRNSSIDGSELDMAVEMAYQTAVDAGNKVTMEQVRKDYLSNDANKDKKLSFEEYQLGELKYMLMASVDPYQR